MPNHISLPNPATRGDGHWSSSRPMSKLPCGQSLHDSVPSLYPFSFFECRSTKSITKEDNISRARLHKKRSLYHSTDNINIYPACALLSSLPLSRFSLPISTSFLINRLPLLSCVNSIRSLSPTRRDANNLTDYAIPHGPPCSQFAPTPP